MAESGISMEKKLLIVNSFCGVGSTGRICSQIAEEYSKKGYTCRIAYGRDPAVNAHKDITYKIGTKADIYIHGGLSRMSGRHGCYSQRATKVFLKWADAFNPDVIWLHNLHGYYLNFEMLFAWIKSRPFMKVRWTLHDCWAFTGHCTYFSMIGCDKWKNLCFKCPQKDSYPASYLIDSCEDNFRRKKTAFCGVQNMTIIVPSQWLANLVKESFMQDYPVEIIYNIVDMNMFKPTTSTIREDLRIGDKFMILGVATDWDKRKGLDDFIELSKMIDEKTIIVLVGLKAAQIKKLPKNIIGVERTDSQEELAGYYTEADVFLNPSKEETFGMTTLEAQYCGTQAVVYKNTACEEVAKKFGGMAVEQSVEELYNTVMKIKQENGGI